MQQRATGGIEPMAAAARTQLLYMDHLLYQLSHRAPQTEVLQIVGYRLTQKVSCGSQTSFLPYILVPRLSFLEVNPKLFSEDLCFLFAMFNQ